MRWITNISITEAARLVLDKERARFKPRGDDRFALVWMSSYVEPDGSTVRGFRPGYTAVPWDVREATESWLFAQLPNGAQFYFWPRFEWKAEETYILDRVSDVFAIFSIAPMPMR